MARNVYEKLVHVKIGETILEGNLVMPQGSEGIVLFAHGSGSSRHSPRNQYVAGVLHEAGLSTLLIDLLTVALHRHHDALNQLADNRLPVRSGGGLGMPQRWEVRGQSADSLTFFT